MSSFFPIRNVPDETRRVLESRAAARGQSLNAYLLELLSREVDRPTLAEVLDRAARRSEKYDGSVLDFVDAARAQRDADLTERIRG